jgi:hypothetical protein
MTNAPSSLSVGFQVYTEWASQNFLFCSYIVAILSIVNRSDHHYNIPRKVQAGCNYSTVFLNKFQSPIQITTAQLFLQQEHKQELNQQFVASAKY